MREGKRGRETQPLFAGKIKKGIKLIYNAKGRKAGNKVVLSCEKQKQQIKKCLATEVFNRVGRNNNKKKHLEIIYWIFIYIIYKC